MTLRYCAPGLTRESLWNCRYCGALLGVGGAQICRDQTPHEMLQISVNATEAIKGLKQEVEALRKEIQSLKEGK